MKIKTANQVSGRATGALFFSGFGALWFLLALYVREQLHTATIAGLLLGLLLFVVYVIQFGLSQMNFVKQLGDVAEYDGKFRCRLHDCLFIWGKAVGLLSTSHK